MASSSANLLLDDLNSEFDEESDVERKRKIPDDLSKNIRGPPTKKADRRFFEQESSNEERKRERILALDAYTRHKRLINDYLLFYPGATKQLQRDSSRDKTDLDVIRDNHKFLWPEGEEPDTWEKKLSKKYYDKLFKEYCITELSRYKENKIAMRWRVEKEVVEGKGQFICGERKCKEKQGLTSWEVNFSYVEDAIKHNTLVKLRLCPDCSYKLNYRTKRRKAQKKPKHRRSVDKNVTKEVSDNVTSVALSIDPEMPKTSTESAEEVRVNETKAKELWSKPAEIEEDKSREEEFEDFLEDLLL